MISKKEWMPLIGMTIAAFVFNTSEFMPVGLLSGIAQTFSISISDDHDLFLVRFTALITFNAHCM